ncbi:hypothetical protein CPA54_04795 [Parasaccharibacter sp. TMW2.1890]|nr:hypothetical protein [Parasaccharibacter sp. TMW2.1890]
MRTLLTFNRKMRPESPLSRQKYVKSYKNSQLLTLLKFSISQRIRFQKHKMLWFFASTAHKISILT